jgi:Transcription factor WhiB
VALAERARAFFFEDVDPWEWRESAACRTLDVSLFFDGPFDRAKEVCRSCPVLETCRRENDREERRIPATHWWGVFGGETPRERAARRSA